jgi:hypothetical protein
MLIGCFFSCGKCQFRCGVWKKFSSFSKRPSRLHFECMQVLDFTHILQMHEVCAFSMKRVVEIRSKLWYQSWKSKSVLIKSIPFSTSVTPTSSICLLFVFVCINHHLFWIIILSNHVWTHSLDVCYSVKIKKRTLAIKRIQDRVLPIIWSVTIIYTKIWFFTILCRSLLLRNCQIWIFWNGKWSLSSLKFHCSLSFWPNIKMLLFVSMLCMTKYLQIWRWTKKIYFLFFSKDLQIL